MFDWIYDLWDGLMDFFSGYSPAVIGISFAIWLLVIGMTWGSPLLVDFDVKTRVVFTILSGPTIFIVFNAIANR